MEAVADTSIIIALLTNEKEREHILQETADYELICAASIEAEIGNAISAMFRRRRVSFEQGMTIAADFKAAKFRTIPLNISRAVEISHSCNIYAYDAYVLECAERLKIPLISLDQGMLRAARELNLSVIEV